MATTVKTRIVKIGNSQGIRIPKLLLEQVNFGDEVELELQESQIIIRSSLPVREGWEAQFQAMAERGDDALLDETRVTTEWDEEDWEWS